MVHRCIGAEPPAVFSPGSPHCACVPRHAERQTEWLLLAKEQPTGCVRVYPILTTYLLNIHIINSQARADSPSKNKVKTKLRQVRKSSGFAEGREKGRNRGKKGSKLKDSTAAGLGTQQVSYFNVIAAARTSPRRKQT